MSWNNASEHGLFQTHLETNMLQKLSQPFTTASVDEAISETISQINDLLSYAQSYYSETVYNQLFHNSETLQRTEITSMFVDEKISYLENLVNTRDAIAQHIQTYQNELNARLAKASKSIYAYQWSRKQNTEEQSEEQVQESVATQTVNTKAVNNDSVDNAPAEPQSSSASNKTASRTRGSNKTQG